MVLCKHDRDGFVIFRRVGENRKEEPLSKKQKWTETLSESSRTTKNVWKVGYTTYPVETGQTGVSERNGEKPCRDRNGGGGYCESNESQCRTGAGMAFRKRESGRVKNICSKWMTGNG